MTIILNGGNPVSNEADLNAALATANAETAGAGAFEIDIGGDIALGSALQAIALASGVTLDIVGGGHAIDGGNTQAGFSIASGAVSLDNLTIQNTVARGADGGAASGGSAGLGGGVYVGTTAAVTLAGVTFNADTAIGGNGGAGNNGGNGAYVYRLFQGYVPVEGVGGQGGVGGAFGQGGGGGNGGVGRTDPNGYEEPNGGANGSGGFGGGSGGYGGQGGGNSPVAGGGGGGGGGGGLGAGGDVYVETGGSLTITGASQLAGSAVGGAGGAGGAGGNTDSSIGNARDAAFNGYPSAGGSGYGGSIFLRGGQTLTFAPGAGQTELILGGIADVDGSSGSTDPAGAGALELNGDGLLDLAAANTFIGGVTLQSGTLELSAAGAAGSGAITFAGASETVEVTAAALQGLGNSLTGFAVGDAIDLLGIVATGVTINASNQLVATNDGAAVATFNLGTIPAYVGAISDGAGGTLILAEASPPPAVSLPLSPYVGAGQTVSIGGIVLADAAADTAGAPVTVTLSDTAGLLEAMGQGVSGSGTAALTITGSTYEVDAALTTLSYTAPAAGGALADTLSIVATDTLGGVSQTSLPLYISQPVTTEAQLNAAIVRADDAVAGSGVITIDVGGDIGFSAELSAINLHAGVSLDIRGHGYTLDGGGAWRGLLVYSGAVSVEDLTLANMAAIGGAGAGSGGGGAGLGGGLFVANDAADGAAPGAVTLSNVNFVGDSASGGSGGATGLGGGGGGLGGAGNGADSFTGQDGADGGGGGVGAPAAGGAFLPEPEAEARLGFPGTGGPGGTGILVGAGAGNGGGGAGGSTALYVSGTNFYGLIYGTYYIGGAGGGVGGGLGSGVGRDGQLVTQLSIGGSGGWGGGGGGGDALGGAGGFGGGGGGGGSNPGTGASGGFGGGGAGAATDTNLENQTVGGGGGSAFGGGAGADGIGGGGGLGAGGGIFVESGASLTIVGQASVGQGAVSGGAGAPGAGNGQAYGSGLFLQGDESITLAPAQGQTITIAGVIADMTGSSDASGATGAGSLIDAGLGTLVLAATNTFTGGVTVDGGTLELAAAGASGTGVITLAGAVGLVHDPADTPADGQTFVPPVAGFADGDSIDLRGLAYTPGAAVSFSGGVLKVSSNNQSVFVNLPGATASAFYAHADPSHGVLISTTPSPTSAWKSTVSGDWALGSAWTSASAPNDPAINLTIAAPGAYTVTIAAGETYATQNLTFANSRSSLNLAGTLHVAGGLTLAGGKITLSGVLDGAAYLIAGTSLTGSGQVTGPLQSFGAVTASGGLLTLAGPVSGLGGTLSITAGAGLELGGAVGSGQTIAFKTGAGLLKLDDLADFQASIVKLGPSQSIDLVGVTVTSDSFAGGVLTLFNGAAQVGALKIGGAYAKKIFGLSSDGAGGTTIALAADAAPEVIAPIKITDPANTPLAITGVTITDANAATAHQTLSVTVSDLRGTLSASAVAGGAVYVSAATALTVVGSLDQVNAALATLTYTETVSGVDKISLLAGAGNGLSGRGAIAVMVPAAVNAASRFVQAMAGVSDAGAAIASGSWTPGTGGAVSALVKPN
jgi:hypothetical protein